MEIIIRRNKVRTSYKVIPRSAQKGGFSVYMDRFTTTFSRLVFRGLYNDEIKDRVVRLL